MHTAIRYFSNVSSGPVSGGGKKKVRGEEGHEFKFDLFPKIEPECILQISTERCTLEIQSYTETCT